MLTYNQYWGKARPSSKQKASYHLLPHHSLDVAACGAVLLEQRPRLLELLVHQSDLPANVIRELIPYYLTIHDLGKFALPFQALAPDTLQTLSNRQTDRKYTVRHDHLGFLVWRKRIRKLQLANWQQKEVCTAENASILRNIIDPAVIAVTGHHGRPSNYPHNSQGEAFLEDHFTTEDIEAALAFTLAASDLHLDATYEYFRTTLRNHASQPEAIQRRHRRLSHWIAGLGVLCDWLGSQADAYFPYNAQAASSLAEYYHEDALPRARDAVPHAGLAPAPARALTSFAYLFPALRRPTPLQHAAETIPLPAEPQLFVIEDSTGSGKTEAAGMFIHRLLAAGLADGLYFALPTTATADAMYTRFTGADESLHSFYRKLFADESYPSIVLAHSWSRLHSGFLRTIITPPENLLADQGETYGADDTGATAFCNIWFTDQRKKALLADAGIGTVDQALLAVLQAKHHALRLIGLTRKVLIVDEVHAYDPYMHHTLRRLLHFHGAGGGSAILLSATLPARDRNELIESYQSGLRIYQELPEQEDDPADPQDDAATAAKHPASVPYPLLTRAGASGIREYAVETTSRSRRRVRIRRIPNADAALDHVLEQAAQGKCVCWIRNTVNDAIEAYEQLRARTERAAHTTAFHTPPDILFHARFALGDRLAIERRVLASFGKTSTATARRGRIVIATPVVEQSLDLDFDVLLSDLAPIDLLLQRLGRLRRHQRDAGGNPLATDSDDGRGEIEFAVVSPDPIDEPSPAWYKADFPRAEYVYRDTGRLWLSARALFERGELHMPDDSRALIEEVYGPGSHERIPPGLRAASEKVRGKAAADRSTADHNTLDLDTGYKVAYGETYADDYRSPSRLGEPTVRLYLARYDSKQRRLAPWIQPEAVDDSQTTQQDAATQQRLAALHAWELSTVTVATRKIAGQAQPEHPEHAQALAAWKESRPDRGRYSPVILLEPDVATNPTADPTGEWTGQARNEKGSLVQVRYSAELGLRVD